MSICSKPHGLRPSSVAIPSGHGRCRFERASAVAPPEEALRSVSSTKLQVPSQPIRTRVVGTFGAISTNAAAP